MSRRLAATLLLLLGTAGLVVTAYWLLFTAFMVYDDEGYVLQTLRDFSAHGGLYREVFSQYGPAFYLLYDLLHRLADFEFTNTTARWLALANWILTAAACAGITWRLSRSVTAAFLALGATFYHLWSMINEPGHPGSLLASILALAAWAGLELVERGRIGWFALLAGMAAALLALIKVNVGLFFLVATVAWLLVNHRSTAWARAGAWGGGAVLGLLPPLLMHHFLGTAWAGTFALLASVAAVAMVGAACARRQSVVPTRDLSLFLAAGLGTALLACLAAMARGTGALDLIDGILLGPMRHPGVYHFAPVWRPGTLPAALFSAALAVWCWRGGHLTWLPGGLATIRLGLGLTILASYAELLPLSTQALAMCFAVPLAWVFVYPLPRKNPADSGAGSAWIGLLLASQYLHAYPIASSQIGWGTFLLLPLATAGTWAAVHQLTRTSGGWMRTARLAGGALACGVALFMSGTLARLGWTRYSDSVPLGLPGAEDLRLPEFVASDLRIVSQNAAAHGDMLMSLPGLYSFNLWTGLPTPTRANATHWFSLLNEAQQRDIMRALDEAGRPVLIVQRRVLDFLHEGGFHPGGPLFDYLPGHFTKVLTLDSYEFWIRNGRSVQVIGTAQLLQPRNPAGRLPARRIDTVVAPQRPVLAMEIMRLDTPLRPLLRLSARNARLAAIPLRLDGTVAGAPSDNAWGRPLPPLARLIVDITSPLPNFDPRFAVVFLLDAQGRRVGEARFIE